MKTMENGFRQLPAVDKLISHEQIRRLGREFHHDYIVELIRNYLDEVRLSIAAGSECPSIDEIANSITIRGYALIEVGLRRVINATGIIIHTNLGRSPISREATKVMGLIASSYSNLEFDLDSGQRGSRNVHVESMLCLLTGAEAALVVNNNASAVMLALGGLARRKEVLVSRSQAVQIGGGFRIPDVMQQSGAKLVEVGTTNCTYVEDYERAINPRTAALMRVHLSNFSLSGFTHKVRLEEMVALGLEHGILVLDDLGSGCLIDTATFGLDPEPKVQDSITAGVGLVFFSGDKLLGGPQAGIIVGKKELIYKLKKHPLARAMRIDKIGLAGLAVTLGHYLKGEAINKLPIWRMISAKATDIAKRAESWMKALDGIATIISGETMVGGGSLPGATLPTRLLAIGGSKRRGKASIAQSLARQLRKRNLPVIGRISGDLLLLDPRSVLPEDDPDVIEALKESAAFCKAEYKR